MTQRRHPEPTSKSSKLRRRWYQHLAIFAAAQAALAVFGHSWALAFFQDAVPGDQPWLMIGGRIWLIVFAVDTVWTWWKILGDRNDDSPKQPDITHKDDMRR
ncbi:MAG: hypothetical protein ACRDXX_04740 [Stackebrandtia sp.]